MSFEHVQWALEVVIILLLLRRFMGLDYNQTNCSTMLREWNAVSIKGLE